MDVDEDAAHVDGSPAATVSAEGTAMSAAVVCEPASVKPIASDQLSEKFDVWANLSDPPVAPPEASRQALAGMGSAADTTSPSFQDRGSSASDSDTALPSQTEMAHPAGRAAAPVGFVKSSSLLDPRNLRSEAPTRRVSLSLSSLPSSPPLSRRTSTAFAEQQTQSSRRNSDASAAAFEDELSKLLKCKREVIRDRLRANHYELVHLRNYVKALEDQSADAHRQLSEDRKPARRENKVVTANSRLARVATHRGKDALDRRPVLALRGPPRDCDLVAALACSQAREREAHKALADQEKRLKMLAAQNEDLQTRVGAGQALEDRCVAQVARIRALEIELAERQTSTSLTDPPSAPPENIDQQVSHESLREQSTAQREAWCATVGVLRQKNSEVRKSLQHLRQSEAEGAQHCVHEDSIKAWRTELTEAAQDRGSDIIRLEYEARSLHFEIGARSAELERLEPLLKATTASSEEWQRHANAQLELNEAKEQRNVELAEQIEQLKNRGLRTTETVLQEVDQQARFEKG